MAFEKIPAAELKALAEEAGLPYMRVRKRYMDLNWPREKALMKNPPKAPKKKFW